MCRIVHYLKSIFLTKFSQSSIQLNKGTKKDVFQAQLIFKFHGYFAFNSSKPKHDITDFSQKKNAADGFILQFKPPQLSYKTHNNENSR